MGNDNGALVWGGRYFDRSCRNYQLLFQLPLPGRHWLSCEGLNRDQRWVSSRFPVSDYLTNNDGYLTCD